MQRATGVTMQWMDYVTVAGFTEHTEVIKGSRFIAWAAPVSTEDEAQELLARARAAHPDATHHCSAWRLGETVRFSDDGEPGGTAGRPMLEVLLRRDLQFAAVIVIRYYGGTKLGAGGLVRAYSGSAAKALDAAGTREVLEQGTLSFTVPFALVDSVLRFVAELPDLKTKSSEYSAEGLELELEMPVGQVAGLKEQLTDHTRDELTFRE